MSKTKIIIALLLSSVLVTSLVGAALALEIREGGNSKVAANEVIDDDVILSGESVTMDGTINGDLIASGLTVTINGTVNGSVILAAQSATINGKINGTIYGAATSLVLGANASVKRNLIYAAASIKTEKGSTVGRDAMLASYQLLHNGEIGRDVKAAAGAVELNGKVGRDVQVDVGEPSPGFGQTAPFAFIPGMPPLVDPGLRISPEAKIGGKLTYTSAAEQTQTIQSKPESGVVYQTPMPDEDEVRRSPRTTNVSLDFGTWVLGRVREFITLLMIGLLALWKLPILMKDLTEMAEDEMLSSAGWGVVTWLGGFIGTALIAILLVLIGGLTWVITLGELSGTVFSLGFSVLGAAFAVFWFLVSYGSKVVVAYFGGKWITGKLSPTLQNNYALMSIGVVVYVALASIPLFGWLVGVAATIIGLGAMWLVAKEWRDGSRAESTAV
ncbi:MAG: polymer-forming cytoskeletal protein [Chloroflexi bacterium]|nr:polymer-forming cytoskeletal protein [Chloroflexota bacterium]